MPGFRRTGKCGSLKEDMPVTKERVDEKARHLLTQMSLKERIEQMEMSDPVDEGIERDYYLDEALAIAVDYLQLVMVASTN